MKKYNLDQLDESLRHRILNHLDVLKPLKEYIHVEVFDPGDTIVQFGKPLDKLYFLVEGKAKISLIHEDGKRSIIHFVGNQEFIGELSLLDVEDEPKEVIAISETICLSVAMDMAKKILLTDAEFLLLLNKYIGSKLLRRTWFNTKSMSYELKNRLAAYILMSEYDGHYNEKHTETTEYLGVSYRHLLHTLKLFQEEGLIKKAKKGYTINRDKLRLLANDIIDK